MELNVAFAKFFERNSMVLEDEDWISGVQKALITYSSGNSNEEEMNHTSTFNFLCRKADKLNKDLSDIRNLEVGFSNYFRCFDEYEDEGEDEDEKQKQKLKENQQKELLSNEAARLIKVMGDITVDLGIPES